MQSLYSNGSQTPGEIALKLVDNAYPDIKKCIQLPTLTGKYMTEALIPNEIDILKES